MAKEKRPGQRRVPQRWCVVCHKRGPKGEMVRVARSTDGVVAVDASGKGPGRGAYLCRQRGCWMAEGMPSRLSRALKTALTDEERAQLRAFASGLREKDDGG